MLSSAQELVKRETEEGTGAAIELEVDRTGTQTALRLWFADLGRARSPIVNLRPAGLKRYQAQLGFGHFAAETISQMQGAKPEELQLARALIRSIGQAADVSVPAQALDSWDVNGPGFSIVAEKRGVADRFGDDALSSACRELVIPMLAAMAELYGYDTIVPVTAEDAALEGAITISLIRRRERNPRNRLLCLRIHGEHCAVCGFDQTRRYGPGLNIIEVHHVQPLGLADEPRPYDPATDLIPLCPNCHRAIHTRRPVPWSPSELAGKLSDA